MNGTGGTGDWDGYVFSWQPTPFNGSGPNTVSPTDTTIYSVTVTDANGCSASGSVTVNVTPKLSLSVQNGIDTVNICFQQDTAGLFANAFGGNDSIYTYTWVTLGIADSNVVSSSQSVYPLINTTYAVIASDGCSLNDTDTVVVMVRDIPQANFITTPEQSCPPYFAIFNGNNSNANVVNPTYSWDFNGDGIYGDDSIAKPTHLFDSSGVFSVSLIIESEFGCPDTFSIGNYITIWPVPDAGEYHIPPDEQISLINSDVQFVDTTSGNPTWWSWNFGDGDTSSLQNPMHTYTDTGTYYVTLIVKNINECPDTILDTIVINNEFAIFVPNAFTPTGDGKNEFFGPKGVGIDPDNYVLYIFDRWGDLIFESHDIDKGWDGRAHGGKDVAQQDVYVWLIVCYDMFPEKNKHRLTGTVTLVK